MTAVPQSCVLGCYSNCIDSSSGTFRHFCLTGHVAWARGPSGMDSSVCCNTAVVAGVRTQMHHPARALGYTLRSGHLGLSQPLCMVAVSTCTSACSRPNAHHDGQYPEWFRYAFVVTAGCFCRASIASSAGNCSSSSKYDQTSVCRVVQ